MKSSTSRPLPDQVSNQAGAAKPGGTMVEGRDRSAALLIAMAWISFAFWVLHGFAVRAFVITLGRLVRKFLLNA